MPSRDSRIIKTRVGMIFGILLGAFWFPVGLNIISLGLAMLLLLGVLKLLHLILMWISYGVMRLFGVPIVKAELYSQIVSSFTVRIFFILALLAESVFGYIMGAEWAAEFSKEKHISLSSFLFGLLTGATLGLILILIAYFGYSPNKWETLFMSWKYSILFILFASFLFAIFSTSICSSIYWYWIRKTGARPERKEKISTSFKLILLGIGAFFLLIHFVPHSLLNQWFSILINLRFIFKGFVNLLILYWNNFRI
jgi:hypothetical protein